MTLGIVLPGWGLGKSGISGIQTAFKTIVLDTPTRETSDFFKHTYASLPTQSLVLIGFSLGGFEAIRIANTWPHLFKGVYVIGIGQGYSKRVLSRIRDKLLSTSDYMPAFIKACFATDQEYQHFLSQGLDPQPLPILLDTLDYLGTFSLTPADLNPPCPLTIFHGVQDGIMPLESLTHWLSQTEIDVVKLPCGHNPFFEHKSCEIINNHLNKIPLE